MNLETSITEKLRDGLAPTVLEVVNESSMHNVAPDSETHFRVFVVSAAFEGKTRVQQHQMIYALVAAERTAGVHAIGIQTMTPAEHSEHLDERTASPPCLGGDGTLERP